MKKSLAVLIVTMIMLAACGPGPGSGSGSIFKEGIVDFINNQYTFTDTVASGTDDSNYSEVYIAENQSIDEVAQAIQNHVEPEKISDKKDNKQVLVYDELFVILTEDEEDSANTMIEVANDRFVRNNYSPSFFQGLLLYSVLNSLLGTNDWDRSQRLKCRNNPELCYGGYSRSGGTFTGYNKAPIRGGSSSVRGGGPGAGK
ncbi:DUF4247 domain-containing protein [Rossellomorea vietnamensis]|uniref:DUF4247 domain-containing protein n=2 Tax=Rossellomorea TaxID=2837508 RepID=A0A5D4KDN8_9BACI|nr:MULTISPECIES: DUF4247 domain-containing protein [Rossellomorea]TYR74825.1 DUF4247 domain-containing protein [Rossellomorea vietnamensis]TYS78316.1 DUF4247 domain-containing protein [Rossellomorea aquimaris]